MTESSPILQVRDLGVSFSNGPVLKNISFTIDRGDFLGIIGPNGSGKTVLVRTLLGALPYSGTITWAPGIKKGYVPQFLDLDRYLSLTLKDFLTLKVRILKLPSTALQEALDAVALPKSTLAMSLRSLSGGQLQRGLIAFAILGKPDIIFFDEPTASVDSPSEEKIYDTIHKLQDEYQLTVALISHELDLVSRYADQILCINKEMICFGEPGVSLKPEILEKLYGQANHIHYLK